MKSLREYINLVNEETAASPAMGSKVKLGKDTYEWLGGQWRNNTTGKMATKDLSPQLTAKANSPSKLGTIGAGVAGAYGGLQEPGTVAGSPTAATLAGLASGGVSGAAAGLGSWAATRAATRGSDPRIGRWDDTPAQTAEKAKLQAQKPGGTAPVVKTNPADFDKWRQNPSSAQLTAPAQDAVSAALPATSATTSAQTARAALHPERVQPQAGQGAKPTAPKAAKPAFKDLGAQYGYNTPEEVQQIQSQLASMGYDIAVDGKFGPKTQAAYQQAYSQMYGQKPGQTDPNAPVPQNYQQGQATKQDLSKDMAAAVGVPNPNIPTPPAAPNANKQALLAKAAEFTKAGDTAKAKIYTDAAARIKESVELDRIKSLINYK